MQIGKGGAKSDTPFDTLNRENAYLHEKVWVETTASSRKMNTENFEKIRKFRFVHALLVSKIK
jgi:hypothetical protein